MSTMKRHVMPPNWPSWAKIKRIDKADHMGSFGATYGVFNQDEQIAHCYPNNRGWAWHSDIEDEGAGQGWSFFPNRFEALYSLAGYLNTIDPGIA